VLNNGRDAALRCPVGAARRPYHSGAPSDLCHPRTKNHAQRGGNAQHDSAIHEIGRIEIVDENPHFYQFTVAAQSSYPLSQSRTDPANPNNQWNF
jgi:hypothetical protein